MDSTFGDTMFMLVPIFIGRITIIIFSFIIFGIVKGIGKWISNNNSPRLTELAEAVTKRTKTSGGAKNSPVNTSYYATSQVESGDRIEFAIKGSEFGLLLEGDLGILAFQGSRYLGFERVTRE